MSDEAVAVEPSDVDTIVWKIWPWMAWLLPLFLFLIYFTSDTASWDVFILIPLSPVIIVAYALLNMIPRRIIGKNKALPDGSALLVCLLLVHWWALIIFEQFAYGSVGNFRWLSSEAAATFAIFSLFVSYTVNAVWRLEVSAPLDTVRERIREVVDEHAWTSPVPPKDKRIELDGQRQLVIEQFTLTDSKGTWVTISVQLPRTDHFEYVDDGTSVVTVHAESPEYWQEKGFLDDWRAATNSPGLDEHSTFTSQEWPEMRSVQGPR